MPYAVRFTERAQKHLKSLSAYERRILLDQIEANLSHEPDSETRNRKVLRPNPVGRFELRVGDLRVFYNIDRETFVVLIVAIGRKVGNRLVVGGEEWVL